MTLLLSRRGRSSGNRGVARLPAINGTEFIGIRWSIMRVLVDSGILIHSEFAKWDVKKTPVRWRATFQTIEVRGLVRKSPASDIDYQREKDALFTVGRLIREGSIEAFDHWEIQCEY